MVSLGLYCLCVHSIVYNLKKGKLDEPLVCMRMPHIDLRTWIGYSEDQSSFVVNC